MNNDQKLGGLFKDWSIVELDDKKRIHGIIYEDGRWRDGTEVTTSEVLKIDPKTKTIITENTVYRYE